MSLNAESLGLTNEVQLAIDRELSKRSFAKFVKLAWHVLEPATPLKWGWVMDAICEHLTAVTEGDIKRLLMNVPPGTSKSLLTGVFWPAWEWTQAPHLRYLGTAHSQTLAVRDNTKCRRLVSSEWYQERWPIKLTTDQNAKTKFENDSFGFREAMAFTSLTGSRGDRVILDDPLSADDANSEAELENARITFTETLPSRVNNEDSAIVVIKQRLNEKDTSGVILDMGLPYDHVMIPMRFEKDRACTTSIGWTDPRKEEGELMFPERFPEEQVVELENTLGSYATAGQLQQRPAPRGGGMFKKEWFEIVPAAPAGTVWARGWDLAASEDKNAARTAGTKMGRAPSGVFYIGDVVKGQLSPGKVKNLITTTASQDGVSVKGSLPQDPGQAGKAQVLDIISGLAGFNYTASPESGSKETRAEPLAAQAEIGNIKLVDGPWVHDFLDEISQFPVGKWADQVDATTRAFMALIEMPAPAIVGAYSAHG